MKENVFTQDDQALVARVACGDDLRGDVERALSALGGLQRLVAPGDTILLKPNFNTEDPPPAASDPAFVSAIIELLTQHGAGKVILGESSMFSRSTGNTLRKAGMLQAAEQAGAEVVCFEDGRWVRVKTGGRYLKKVGLAQAALEAEKIVYACCLKTHKYADFTMAIKMAMGFVRPLERPAMHLHRLREKLVDLNLAIAPDLVLVDARRCFISGGPMSGEVREPGLILASGDRIAVDVEGLKVIQGYPEHGMQAPPWELPMIRRAVELGLGATGEDDYRVVTVDR